MRRHPMIGVIAVAAAMALAGCAGASIHSSSQSSSTLTVGFLLPQTGPYEAIGPDMKNGFQLYLNQHGGKLGGHTIKVVYADEGDGGATARTSVTKLIGQDHASVIIGGANADAITSIAASVTAAKVPLVGVGGRPSTLTDVSYIWHTSFQSTDFGHAVAAYVHTHVNGPVYVIGPDYQGGYDEIGGFVQAFTADGGRLASPSGKPAYTPWPTTTNFAPWLAKIKDSGAKAVYAFYAGAPSVAFVKQYHQFLGNSMPLYAPAFMTEGGVLSAEGADALGIDTVSDYAANLTNAANTSFVTAYTGAYHAAPNLYDETSYDAAIVLDQAIAAAGNHPTGQAINTAIGHLGTITSPRGTWQFNTTDHTPTQPWYLRQVQDVNGTPTNVMLQTLPTAS